ncbi:MAG TPA: META domain-containing protein [Actinomycetes bacterium]|nr:META domain-containing protein [Actinomycetes bacterium]
MRQGGLDPSLTRTEWQLTSVVAPSGTWSPPPEVDAVLRFDGEGHFSATACNRYGGPVRIDGDLLHVRRMFGTLMGCIGPRRAVEEAFLGVVDGEVRWAISGNQLRLDKPDGRGLRFRVRDTIYPSRELRPLLQASATAATTGSAGRRVTSGSAWNGSGATRRASPGGRPGWAGSRPGQCQGRTR